MNTQTSNLRSSDSPVSTVVLRPDRSAAVADAQPIFHAASSEPGQWIVEEVGPMGGPAPVAIPIEYSDTAPPCVYEFVREVAEIPSVLCVVAEEVDRIVHVTTFVHPHSQSDAERIYSVEARIIGANPAVDFDFHVRKASDTEAGTPDIPSGAHFFVVWGGLENVGPR